MQTLHHCARACLQLGVRLMDTTQEQTAILQKLMHAMADFLGVVPLLRINLAADNVHQHMRCDKIGQHDNDDADGKKVKPKRRKICNQAEIHGVNQPHNCHAGDAEQNQIADPHAAVQIHRLLAVVPPARMEQLLHIPTGKVLKRAANHKSGKKSVADRAGYADQTADANRDRHNAAAVNRAVRPNHKAAVDKTMILNILQRNLNHPTDDRENKEQDNQLADKRRHGKLLFVGFCLDYMKKAPFCQAGFAHPIRIRGFFG